ncbi:hypothetical protein D3C78_843400 [compost metagenome]
MAPGVINQLEMVDIKKHNGKLFFIQQRGVKAVLEADIHLMAIGKARQNIEPCLQRQLRIQLTQIIGQALSAEMRVHQ